MEAIKTKVASLEKALNSSATPETMKPKMKEQLSKLQEQLMAEEAKEAAKADMQKEKAPKKVEEKVEPKKKAVKKVESKKEKVVKKSEPSKPKRLKEAEKSTKAEDPSCDDLMEKWKKQRENSKKAGKRYKKTSVSEKIGDNIASAVSKAIHNIPLTEIKEKPKVYIAKFERVEAYVSEFSKGLKSILGDDFDKEEIMKPFEEVVGKFISEIKKKYGK